jgi:predicted DNA-binding transcriptional regulator YafY
MTFLSRDIENGFSRWLLMFMDFAVIVEPKRLKERVLELLENYKTGLLT